MTALTNPYVLKIYELNKEIDRLKIDKFFIESDLNEYKRNPVATICIDSIKEDLQKIMNEIQYKETQIIKVSKFIR